MTSISPEKEASPVKSDRPVTARVPSKEVLPETVRVEPRVVAPLMDAVPPTSKVVVVSPPALIPTLLLPVTSKFVDTETPPENVQKPLTVSFWEREAGPPAPQSSEMVTSLEPEASKAKWAGLKEILATVVSLTPDSL